MSSAANIADGQSRDDCHLLPGVRREECDLRSLVFALQRFVPELSVSRGS